MALTTMIDSHPYDLPTKEHAAALEALLDCAAHCRLCADACLSEDDVASMVGCIRSDLDCATICSAAAEVIARPGSSGAPWRQLLEVCIAMCESCAEECGAHDHAHCQECAEACRRCAEACRALLDAEDAA